MTVTVCAALLVLTFVFIRHIPSPPVRYAVLICSISMCAGWVGYLLLRTSSGGGSHGLTQHSLGMATFGVGTMVAATAPRRQRKKRTKNRVSIAPRSAWFVLVGLCSLTAFHFSRIGIPILSPNVDLDRWNFTGSGLLGLPGRAYSLGLPFFMVFAIVSANRCPPASRRQWQRLRWAAIGAVVVSRVAGGFKGELLETVIMIAIATLLSSPSAFALPTGLRKRLTVGVLVALGAALLISTQYYATQYHEQHGGLGVGEQFVQRITTMVVDSGSALIGMADHGDRPLDRNSIVNDFDVYLGGSFKLWNVDGEYLINQRISARMNHRDLTFARDLSAAHYIVPVTPGFAAISYYDFGWIGVAAVGFLLGDLLALLATRALASKSAMSTFLCVLGVDGLRNYVQKGDLPYVVINYTLVTAGIVAGLRVAHYLAFQRRIVLDGHRVVPDARPPLTEWWTRTSEMDDFDPLEPLDVTCLPLYAYMLCQPHLDQVHRPDNLRLPDGLDESDDLDDTSDAGEPDAAPEHHERYVDGSAEASGTPARRWPGDRLSHSAD